MRLFIFVVLACIFFSCQNPTIKNPEAPPIEQIPIVPEKNEIGEIILNPNNKTPLSAVYKITQINTREIIVTVKGKDNENDITHIYPSGYGKEFAIHGMYPDTENTIVINDSGRIITKKYSIGTILNKGIQIDLNVDIITNKLFPEASINSNPDLYFVWYIEPNYTFTALLGISNSGKLRYANFYDLYSHLHRMEVLNNEILIIDDTGIEDLLGNKILDVGKYPNNNTNYYHHDSITKGMNFVRLASTQWGVEDRVIETDSKGQIIRDLTFGKLIRDIVNSNENQTVKEQDIVVMNQIILDDDNIYLKDGVETAVDWAHANSLVYDNSKDIMYFSLRHLGVLAVNYAEWKLLWWMADDTLQTDAYYSPNEKFLRDLQSLEPYQVTGAGKTDGPKNQHALFLLPGNRIGMFDNQGDESANPSGSRYVEYEITSILGSYSAIKTNEFRKADLYSRFVSDVDFVPYQGDYNSILLIYGGSRDIIEINRKNTNEVLYHMKLQMNATTLYRIDKMPFYYEKNRLFSADNSLR